MEAVATPQIGDTFTIAGMYEFDRRWWPRLCAWLLRRPAPRTGKLQNFRVTEVV